MGSYEAFRRTATGFESVGRFELRKAAIKQARKDGLVVFHAGSRVFLSWSHYLTPRATIDLLCDIPGLEHLTV